jgi:hydroxylamine reductase
MCGKKEDTAKLQDMLVFALKGLAAVADAAGLAEDTEIGHLVSEGLFVTITNTNFDDAAITAEIAKMFKKRDEVKAANADKMPADLPEAATWSGAESDYVAKGAEVGVLSTANEDVRSLRELLIYGLKGIAAYAHHASVLGADDKGGFKAMVRGLVSTTKDLSVDEMVAEVLAAGEAAVGTMAVLDAANTGAYGTPEITEVDLGVGDKPGILISGHDLKDLEMLLEQIEAAGANIDVYTHGEMLPAHYYPKFKGKLRGNYGNAWWQQKEEFEAFNGPILMTTNCIVPVKDSYKDRIFTTGAVGWPGVKHIEADADGGKDFSEIIAMAKTSQAPKELETGKIVGGFAHAQVMALADKVIEAVQAGAIKRFVVMAGCDGRHKTRDYFTKVAEQLPEDAVILTAGCAKYRYNKLDLGDIGGIPRVLDAGQCNDSYSLAVIALKLKEAFGLDDINDLPLSFDIAWYEQKAVAVLLALLHLGVKGIRLGPTLPAFVSPNVLKVLVENFDIKPTATVEEDVAAIMEGR